MARILVVDDNKETNVSLAELFKGEGHEVFTAFDGIEALEVLSKEVVDLMVLDLQMPRMRGEEVVRRLKRFPLRKELDIVIYSSIFSGDPTRITFSCLDTETLRNSKQVISKKVNSKSTGSPSQQLLEAVNQLIGERKKKDAGQTARPEALKTPRILVVEDNIDTSNALKSLLEGEGYDVLLALDGQQALDILGKEQVSLVTLDLNLPKISGSQVLAQMRSDLKWAGIPVIVTSANAPSAPTSTMDALEGGAFGNIVQKCEFPNTDFVDSGSSEMLLSKIKEKLNSPS